jgi:hypothetical protein
VNICPKNPKKRRVRVCVRGIEESLVNRTGKKRQWRGEKTDKSPPPSRAQQPDPNPNPGESAMSTEAKTEPQLRLWNARLIRTLSTCPVAQRTILVRVFKHKDGHSVFWDNVVAFVIRSYTNYTRKAINESLAGATHEEMTELGWSSEVYEEGDGLDAFPITSGDNFDYEDVLRFPCAAFLRSSEVYQAVVPCFWEPTEDEQHAIRIGKEFVENGFAVIAGSGQAKLD